MGHSHDHIRVVKVIYDRSLGVATQMFDTAYRTSLFAFHQLAVLAGIFLLPVALLARQMGIQLPLGRVIESTNEAYRKATR